MPSVSLHRCSAEDAARVRAVRLRALATDPDAFWTTLAEDRVRPLSWWRKRLADPGAATFLAVLDGDDVGLVVGAAHHDIPREAGLYAMWVAPTARRTGVGTRLIGAVLEWARELGYPRIRLEVADANTAAIAAYGALGFTPTGRTATMPAPREHITEHELARPL